MKTAFQHSYYGVFWVASGLNSEHSLWELKLQSFIFHLIDRLQCDTISDAVVRGSALEICGGWSYARDIYDLCTYHIYINLGIRNFDTKIDIWHLYAEAPVEVVLCVLVFWFIVASL